MLEDKDPDELREIADIAENHGLDVEDAEKVKDLMDEEDIDEDIAAVIVEEGL